MARRMDRNGSTTQQREQPEEDTVTGRRGDADGTGRTPAIRESPLSPCTRVCLSPRLLLQFLTLPYTDGSIRLDNSRGELRRLAAT
jgi:hypothetical protein